MFPGCILRINRAKILRALPDPQCERGQSVHPARRRGKVQCVRAKRQKNNCDRCQGEQLTRDEHWSGLALLCDNREQQSSLPVARQSMRVGDSPRRPRVPGCTFRSRFQVIRRVFNRACQRVSFRFNSHLGLVTGSYQLNDGRAVSGGIRKFRPEYE
jgi:hypothetical protein